MREVTETADFVGFAYLARCMDSVDHGLEIDRCVVGAQIGQTRVGTTPVDVCHHRIVASHAYLGIVGAIIAVQRERIVSVIALFYVDNHPSRQLVRVRNG